MEIKAEQQKEPDAHKETLVNDDGSGKKRRKRNPKEGFLARVNIEELKKELGMSSAEEIGVFLNLSNPKGVYNWNKEQDNHGTRPSYNAIVRMLRKGATPKTLFGVESVTDAAETEPHKIVITDDLVAEMLVRAGEMLKNSSPRIEGEKNG